MLTDQGANAPSIYYAVFALIASDALDLADAVLESALEQARNRGSVFAFSIASAMRSFVAYRRGDVIAAEGEARAAVEAAALNIGAMPNAVAYLADALIERGQLDAAGAALAEVVVGDEILRGNLDQAILGARGRLRLAAGQLSEACEDFRELGERFARWGTDHPAWTNYRALMAACLSGLGRREEALAAAAQDLELARRWGTARAVGLALRARGLALGGDDGVATLREAATVLGESPARLEYARVLIDLALRLRRGITRAAAREPLREAMDLCGRLGAVTLGDRARDELRATGARPRRVLLTGVDALTPSELRIGRMAASGLSNPEIAQALFVTRKNVEARLGNAYRKLEINSRDQLAAALEMALDGRTEPTWPGNDGTRARACRPAGLALMESRS